MKRLIPLFLALVLLLCACGKAQTVFTIEKNGHTLTVNTENLTVYDGTNTYRYLNTGFGTGSKNVKTTIYYPDGSTYWWSASTSGGVTTGGGGWSDDYDETRYIPGETLVEAVEQALETASRGHDVNWVWILCGLFCIAYGIFGCALPEKAWYLGHLLRMWQYRELEPTEAALSMTRFGGGLSIAVGVFLMIGGL